MMSTEVDGFFRPLMFTLRFDPAASSALVMVPVLGTVKA